MKPIRLSRLALWIALAILLALPVAVVAAQAIWGSSADEGYVAPKQPASVQILGDDPDENGYSGPIYEIDTPIPDSSEIDGFDPALFMPQGGEPQEDEIKTAASLNSASSINGWSELQYLSAAGSTLRPRNSTTAWTSGGSGGCIYSNSGTDTFNVNIQLPDGAQVNYLRLFYYDTSPADSIAFLTTYDGAGGFTDVFQVSSTNAAGFGTTLSPYGAHIVDNHILSYVLNWKPFVAGSTMQLCGLQIAYRLPTP